MPRLCSNHTKNIFNTYLEHARFISQTFTVHRPNQTRHLLKACPTRSMPETSLTHKQHIVKTCRTSFKRTANTFSNHPKNFANASPRHCYNFPKHYKRSTKTSPRHNTKTSPEYHRNISPPFRPIVSTVTHPWGAPRTPQVAHRTSALVVPGRSGFRVAVFFLPVLFWSAFCNLL